MRLQQLVPGAKRERRVQSPSVLCYLTSLTHTSLLRSSSLSTLSPLQADWPRAGRRRPPSRLLAPCRYSRRRRGHQGLPPRADGAGGGARQGGGRRGLAPAPHPGSVAAGGRPRAARAARGAAGHARGDGSRGAVQGGGGGALCRVEGEAAGELMRQCGGAMSDFTSEVSVVLNEFLSCPVCLSLSFPFLCSRSGGSRCGASVRCSRSERPRYRGSSARWSGAALCSEATGGDTRGD